MAAQIEAYRAGRAYVGILFFCGLTSSNPAAQGITGDILSPDVSTAQSLQIRPYTKELLRNAFANLGISIGLYEEELRRGERVRLPITLTNDTGKAITDLPVTIKIMSEGTLLYAERFTMSVDARSETNKGSATEIRTITVPAYREYCKTGKTLVVTASYELDGETVYSQRKWEMERTGNFTDDPLPTYDWLESNGSGETETDTETQVTEPAESDTAATEPADSVTETQDPTHIPATDKGDETEGGCKSAVSGAILLTCAASAAVVLGKRRSEEE